MRALDIQVPERWESLQAEGLVTQVCQTLTQAAFRTRNLITQPFVVSLRTLLPAVTHILRQQAHAGATTTVEAFTSDVITSFLILTSNTVVVTVTTCELRKAVHVHSFLGTSQMSAWAWKRRVIPCAFSKPAISEIYNVR
jgi:hypothetical protein